MTEELSISSLSFPPDRLLFGRDEEQSKMRSIYKLVVSSSADAAGRTRRRSDMMANHIHSRHAIAVSGPHGAGRTSLANVLRDTALKDGNYFCSGSFDSSAAAAGLTRPYSAIVDALGQLAQSLLDDEAACLRLRKEMSEEVRAVVTRLVPAMGLVLGFDPIKSGIIPREQDKELVGAGERRRRRRHRQSLVGLGASASLVQLTVAIQTLIRQVCSGGNVLVFVADNLDRADTSSFEIIESLAADGCPGLLLICTCQSGADEPAALSSLLKYTSDHEGGICVHRISIGGLDQVAVNLLLAYAMKTDPEKIEMLAAIVFKKTIGNAAFVVEFTKSLVEKGLLTYNFGIMQWQWEDAGVRALPVADNVSDIFRERLTSLPAETSQLLSICSCLGTEFHPEMVALIVGSLREETHLDSPELNLFQELTVDGVSPAINASLDEGLIERRSFELLTFAHEELQDASFLMIPVEVRTELQYLIGRALVDNLSPEELDEVLFVAVNLLNHGIALGVDLIKLAELNLSTGRKAVKMAAFSLAANHFATCIDCINGCDDLPWETHFDLYEESYQAAAMCEGQLGNYERMQSHLDHIFENVDNSEARMQAYCTQTLSAFNTKAEVRKCFDTVFGALNELLGERFPSKPTIGLILLELVRTKRLLKKYPTDQHIIQLPIMQDRTRILAMKMLQQLFAMAWVSDPKYFPLFLFRMIQWTCRYGLCAYSAGAFAAYGTLLTGVMKDLKGGQRYGQLGVSLLHKLKEDDVEDVGVEYAYVVLCAGQSESFQMSAVGVAKKALVAYQVGMESGDTCYSFRCLNLWLMLLYFSGKPLPLIRSEMERALPQMKHYGQDFAYFRLGCMLQMIVNLEGDAVDPYSLSGDIIGGDENDIGGKYPLSMLKYALALKLSLAYLLGNYNLAAEMSDRTQDFATKYAIGHMLAVRATFFDGLTALALLSKTMSSCSGSCVGAKLGSRKWEKRKNLRIKAMRQWVKKGNINAQHMLQLLEAEDFSLAARGANDLQVRGKYDQAIKTAAKAGYLQDAALANQRAGVHFVDKDRHWAKIYLAKSYELWSEYGAGGIIRRLLATYPRLIHSSIKDQTSERSLRLLDQMKRGSDQSTLFHEPQFNELTSGAVAKKEKSVSFNLPQSSVHSHSVSSVPSQSSAQNLSATSISSQSLVQALSAPALDLSGGSLDG